MASHFDARAREYGTEACAIMVDSDSCCLIIIPLRVTKPEPKHPESGYGVTLRGTGDAGREYGTEAFVRLDLSRKTVLTLAVVLIKP
jgi:hypothetical protein